MEKLAELIKGLSLSKTEKAIADYLLANQSVIGLKTATSLALEIGTSDTSIIRFIRRLGFKSYADFKQEMGIQLLDQYHASLRSGSRYLRAKPTASQGDLINEVLSHAVNNLQKTCEALDGALVSEAADLLIRSRFKYIAGFHTTSACALYMRGKLMYFLPNVVLLGQSESIALERIIDIDASDCLLLYSFPMYSEINSSLLELVHKHGAKCILVTDQITSPLAAKADLVLSASISGFGSTNSYIAPMCLSEILLFMVSRRIDATQEERASEIDTYLDRHKLY